VFVISGPSGVGKDSIIQRLLPLVDVDTIVTITTRQPRADEIDGIHYRFVSEEIFKSMLENGELLEHAFVHGNWYGVPADSVRASITCGRDVLIKVDPQGARNIKHLMPDAIFIFIRPTSLEELRGRLVARASETPEEMALRMHNAVSELSEAAWFDYVVDNPDGQIDLAVDELQAIIATVDAFQGA
jgi:guanylate kinase